MASKLFQGYETYEQYLAAMANAYGSLNFDDITIAENPSEVIQVATDQAKAQRKSNRRKTALIIAGLVVGTVLTGGALGIAAGGVGALGGALAGLGSIAGISASTAIGAGVLGVSGAALGLKWKTVYNTLNPRASRDPDVLFNRFLIKEDRWNRRLANLEEKMKNARNEAERSRIRGDYQRAIAAHQKFLSNYTRSSVFSKVRMDCKSLAQERPGIMGQFDKYATQFREGMYNNLGVEYFAKKHELMVEKSEQLMDLMEKAQASHEARAIDNGIKIDPTKREELDKIRKDTEYWYRLADGKVAETVDWAASPAEKQEMEQYLNAFPKDVQKALDSNLKGKNLNLEDIKSSINGALKNNQAFNQYALQTIDYALKNCDIDLVTLNVGEGSASVDKDAVNVINYIVQNDMVKDLSKEAQGKLFEALNQSNNICDKELKDTIKKDYYDYYHTADEDSRKESTSGYNSLLDGLDNYRHEQEFNKERKKLEKRVHAQLCDSMGLSTRSVGGYSSMDKDEKEKFDKLYDQFSPLFKEMEGYIQNPKQDKSGNYYVEMPLDKLQKVADKCITDSRDTEQTTAAESLLGAFGKGETFIKPDLVNSFINLSSNGTLQADLDGTPVVHGEKKPVIRLSVSHKIESNAQQTVNRGNSFNFGDNK